MSEFKKIILPILGVIVFIIAFGLYGRKIGFLPTPEKTVKIKETAEKLTTIDIKVNNIPLKVEVAKTAAERKEGLSNRKSLKNNEGMLFVFENKDVQPVFWMKNVLFGIDIIWIKNNTISGIEKNVPIPKEGVDDKNLPTYRPQNPIDYALETVAGFADANGLKVGQPVDLSAL